MFKSIGATIWAVVVAAVAVAGGFELLQQTNTKYVTNQASAGLVFVKYAAIWIFYWLWLCHVAARQSRLTWTTNKQRISPRLLRSSRTSTQTPPKSGSSLIFSSNFCLHGGPACCRNPCSCLRSSVLHEYIRLPATQPSAELSTPQAGTSIGCLHCPGRGFVLEHSGRSAFHQPLSFSIQTIIFHWWVMLNQMTLMKISINTF